MNTPTEQQIALIGAGPSGLAGALPANSAFPSRASRRTT